MIKPFSKFWHDKKGQMKIFGLLVMLLGVLVAIPIFGESEKLLDEGFTNRNFNIVNENITLVADTNVSLANQNIVTGISVFNASITFGITENALCSSLGSCNATVWLATGLVQANGSVACSTCWNNNTASDNTTLINYTYTRIATAPTSTANKTLSELVIAFGVLALLFGILRSSEVSEQ